MVSARHSAESGTDGRVGRVARNAEKIVVSHALLTITILHARHTVQRSHSAGNRRICGRSAASTFQVSVQSPYVAHEPIHMNKRAFLNILGGAIAGRTISPAFAWLSGKALTNWAGNFEFSTTT